RQLPVARASADRHHAAGAARSRDVRHGEQDMAKAKQSTDPSVGTAGVGHGKKSPSNVSGDPSQSLLLFDLVDLQKYTLEGSYAPTASKDFHLFFVGRDDVHDILKHVLSRVRVSLYVNMFGYDDEELNDILMQKALDPNVTMLITLDKSQAGGKHEKTLLDAD